MISKCTFSILITRTVSACIAFSYQMIHHTLTRKSFYARVFTSDTRVLGEGKVEGGFRMNLFHILRG